MQIDFYEEFPTKENLQKLKLIKYPIRLFVATKSIEEFKGLEKRVKQLKKDTKVAYWPIIRNSYWISPFSNTKDLINLFRKLDSIKNHLLIDLEMPKNKTMMLKNILSFFKNKSIIRRFMEENKQRITTAQPIETIFSRYIQIRGQNFNIKTEKSFMWYTSMLPNKINKIVKRKLNYIKNKEDYSISLGTIAYGILGNEPILSPKNLEKDLQFVKRTGFNKVIIFRLGGLNKEYIKVINKFQN